MYSRCDVYHLKQVSFRKNVFLTKISPSLMAEYRKVFLINSLLDLKEENLFSSCFVNALLCACVRACVMADNSLNHVSFQRIYYFI